MIDLNLFQQKFGNAYKFEKVSNGLLKFLHASDIHLGSSQYRNTHRANDFIRAFHDILILSILHHVDFIILGGDVFTSLEMLPGKLIKIVRILTDFKSYTGGAIPIISIEGNHDIRKFSRGVRFAKRGQSWLKLLSQLGLIILLDVDPNAPPEQMFKLYDFERKKGGKIIIKNAVIYGSGYISQDPEEFIQKIYMGINKEDGLFNILLQHFGIEGQMENVPGIKYHKVIPLKTKIDYLALGHYHLQFILDDWIFNPGSSEAACSVDFSYKRGVFLVEVKKEKRFIKNVQNIRLNNRNYIWQTIYFKKQYKNKSKLYKHVLNRLKTILNYLKKDLEPSDTQMPILFLVLKGIKPMRSCRILEKELSNKIIEEIPVVDVRIYQKFNEPLITIEKYL